MYDFHYKTTQFTGKVTQVDYDSEPEHETYELPHDICVEVVKHNGSFLPVVWDRQSNVDEKFMNDMSEKLEEWLIKDLIPWGGDLHYVELDNGICVYDDAHNRGRHIGWAVIQAWIIDELNDYTHED
jgi:hypothetical protein